MAPKLKTYGKRPLRRRINLHLPALSAADLAGPLGQPCTRDELGRIMSFVPPNHQPEPLRPKSQKAATMSVEPNDEQISTLVAITGADEGTAKRFLRVSSHLIIILQSRHIKQTLR